MATQIVLTDDLDGSTKDVRTVRFALDGKPMEIDLSPANVDKLTKALAPFMDKARTPGSNLTQRAPRGTSNRTAKQAERDYDPEQVREWQAANGRKVTVKGRFPTKDLDDYRQQAK